MKQLDVQKVNLNIFLPCRCWSAFLRACLPLCPLLHSGVLHGKASLTSRLLIASIHSFGQCGTGDSGVQGMLTSECPRSCRHSASCSLRWLETKLDFRKSVLSSYLTNDSWTEISLSLSLLAQIQTNFLEECFLLLISSFRHFKKPNW